MTDQEHKWTRRRFSQLLAATAASSVLARKASALPIAHREGFAFAGTAAVDPMDGTVRVFRVSGQTWREVHAVRTASPAHLVMHPTLPMLYVLHDVAEWQHRPRGAVSAYRFDSAIGRLDHAGTQPLSLSATHPRCAIVVAEGTALFVSTETGGIYNVLPIAADGTLQPVSAIRKEFGMEDSLTARIAAPRHMILRPDGDVHASDRGKGTISQFTVSRDAITLRHRSRMDVGSQRSPMAVSPFHEEDGRLSATRPAAMVKDATSLLLHLA